MQTNAICVSKTGGPDMMNWQPVALGSPGPTDVLLEHKALGLNFIDVYHRSGVNPVPLPFTPGVEGAGVVLSVGRDVAKFQAGDRVAYCTGVPGGYAEHRIVPADILVRIPENISYETTAAMLLKGLTTEYLIRRAYPVQQGDTVLFHAIAGGVGTLACQWLKKLGATVIGTVGSEEKAAFAKAHGCDHTILYRSEDIKTRVHEITNGKGVPVVFDSVGKTTFAASLDCLSPCGYMLCFGNASGPVDPVALTTLLQKGSLFLSRPSLAHYCATPQDLTAAANTLFETYTDGLDVHIGNRFSLKDAADAHRHLESRQTTGSTILIPA